MPLERCVNFFCVCLYCSIKALAYEFPCMAMKRSVIISNREKVRSSLSISNAVEAIDQ